MSKQPTWNTPARLNGLPCTNWKKRTGVTMNGTLDACITRWLDLAGYQQANCTLGWGPNEHGQSGSWSATAIGSYVRRNGLPPTMTARRGSTAGPEVLAKLTAMDRYDPPPGPHSSRPDPSRSQRPNA